MKKPNLDSDILTVSTPLKADIFALAEIIKPATSGTALARHIIGLGLAEYLRQNPGLQLKLADLQHDQQHNTGDES